MNDHFWHMASLVGGFILNMGTYVAMISSRRRSEERRQKKNLLSDGQTAYKFECMWADYKKEHNIAAKNGDE